MKRNKAVQAITPAQTPDSTTVIEFLLDETGSMSSCRDATIGGFNEYLNQQRAQPGKCLLTLTKFDTVGLRTPYVDLDIHMVPYLDTDTYVPNSMTNLYDAIGHRITALEQRLVSHQWQQKPHVLYVIMTDGMDNSSVEHSAGSIRELIKKKEGEGWTFVYLGANQDAWAVGATFGMSKGNTMTYDTAKMKQTMSKLSAATTSYRTVRASGEVQATEASYNFFAGNDDDTAAPDLSAYKQKVEEKKRALKRAGVK